MKKFSFAYCTNLGKSIFDLMMPTGSTIDSFQPAKNGASLPLESRDNEGGSILGTC